VAQRLENAPDVVDARLQFDASVAPNPARRDALLRLATTRPGPLRVRLYDVTGRVHRVLLDEANAAPGERALSLSTRGRGRIEPGVYFYRVEAAEGALTGRCVMIE